MKHLTTLVFLLFSSGLFGQSLKAGFDKTELIELLKVGAQFGDSAYVVALPKPERFRLAYRSPVMGLENRWDLWGNGGSVAVVSVRGTTAASVSWLANFYAAMVPAKGELTLADDYTFTYQLAEHPKAAVHVGWLVSTAFLSRDILPKIDSCYRAGTKNIIVTGHSQGGGISYLLTAYLYSLQKQGKLPADIRFKTYCGAAPKPGNLFFAYDYEATTQGGWAYNVINAADWVPEVPLTVQTLTDFSETNPFKGAPDMIKKQKLGQRLVLNYVYKKLSRPSLKAQRNYQKYLGQFASKNVAKALKGFVAPDYFPSSDYVRTGAQIVLLPDADYYKKYPDSDKTIFVHHFHAPYLYLAGKLP